ncbi:unnamed protein product [Microthlaspi erraticum]|uniref:Uncharacterized protein n=1 Tax=Microthlaspi erraticum TaxID=1685480 RepID=A0A6D2L6G9_9BRAS|nr:unnamed protein product [Microthlaspi erraticum]CAA7056756.1 unnamed protein product [Microthlaspi erraticum]
MLRRLILRQVSAAVPELEYLHGFNQHRGIHSRNKKAMYYVAKGWSAIKEVGKVMDYCGLVGNFDDETVSVVIDNDAELVKRSRSRSGKTKLQVID